MKQQIEAAFAHRQRPATVTEIAINSELRDDARHFEGMDWTQVTGDDWHQFRDAFYGFSPAAFAYFLPSLLMATLGSTERGLLPAESLVAALDTSADTAVWDEWFVERFPMLALPELDVLDDWLVIYLDGEEPYVGSTIVRARETIMMLRMLADQ